MDRLLDLSGISGYNQEFILKHFEKGFGKSSANENATTIKNILKKRNSTSPIKKIYKKDLSTIRMLISNVLMTKFIIPQSQHVVIPNTAKVRSMKKAGLNVHGIFLLNHVQKESLKLEQMSLDNLINELRKHLK